MGHKLSDETLITPALLRRFIAEGELEDGNGQHFAVIQMQDGSYCEYNPYSPEADPLQAGWVRDVLRMLNSELHYDGAWVCCFTHPAPTGLVQRFVEYNRCCWIWLDRDGDPQFTSDWVKDGHHQHLDFADVVISGVVSQVQRCEMAYSAYFEMMQTDMLDAKPEHKFRRALGEKAPSARS
jgi:hypothetical protein